MAKLRGGEMTNSGIAVLQLRYETLSYEVHLSSCRCAYLVGNIQEYIGLSLELMGRCIFSLSLISYWTLRVWLYPNRPYFSNQRGWQESNYHGKKITSQRCGWLLMFWRSLRLVLFSRWYVESFRFENEDENELRVLSVRGLVLCFRRSAFFRDRWLFF